MHATNDVPLQIQLLGSFSIQHGTQCLTPLLARKTQALLAYLVMQPSLHSRRHLIEWFCANADDPHAALRWHLSRIRHALGVNVLVTNGDHVQFNAAMTWVDCIEFERALKNAELSDTTAAVQLYRGDFLSDLALPEAPEFELWVIGARARLRGLFERGLSELIARLIAQRQYDEALRYAQQLVSANPLLEQAHAHLIWLYAQTGQRAASLQQFETCRALLQRELAVEPTAELIALQRAVQAGSLQREPTLVLTPPHGREDWPHATDFVGRARELALLKQHWQQARAGHGSVVLIEAEAGGGKTRLMHELAQAIMAEMPARVLRGQCYESTRALPYRPWIELLDVQTAQLDDQTLSQLSRFWLEPLTRLLPSLAVRVAHPAAAVPGENVEQLFTAVSELLFRLRDTPLLLLVDNLQWADEASLRLFHFLARRMSQTAALLIGAFRSEDVTDTPALQLLLNDLRRDAVAHVRLPPLTLEAISTLIARLWSKLPDGYRPHVSALLMHATGGNPLFVSEVLRELAHGETMPRGVPVPASVRELIQQRLNKLPESARQVIEAMAVVGEPLTLAQAQQTSARSEDETVAAIDFGLRSGLLHVQTHAPRAQYDFTHDLVREAVSATLSEVRRRVLHRRAAYMLAQDAGRESSAQRAESAGRIVRHAWAGEDAALVWHWAPLAAEHAKRLGAYADALDAYTRAGDALAQLRDDHANNARGEQQELELLLCRVEMLRRLGRRAEEGALLQQAEALLAHVSDAALVANYDLRKAAHLTAVNAYERAFTFAHRSYEQYLLLDNPLRAAEALHAAGDAKQSMGDARTALQLQEQSLALYRTAGDARGEARVLAEIGWSLIDLGEIDNALAHLGESLRLAEQEGDVFGRAYTSQVLATAWSFYYQAERIRFYARQSHQLFQYIGNEAAVTRAIFYGAVADYDAELLLQAHTNLLQAFAQAQRNGDGWCEGWAAQLLGRLALRAGDLAAAEQWLMHAYQLRLTHQEAQNTVNDLAWLGRLRLAQNAPTQALEHTTEAVTRLSALRSHVRVFELADVYLAHAEALGAGRHARQARTYIQRAHKQLMQFAQQIRDAELRARFLAHPFNARILVAAQRNSAPRARREQHHP